MALERIVGGLAGRVSRTRMGSWCCAGWHGRNLQVLRWLFVSREKKGKGEKKGKKKKNKRREEEEEERSSYLGFQNSMPDSLLQPTLGIFRKKKKENENQEEVSISANPPSIHASEPFGIGFG